MIAERASWLAAVAAGWLLFASVNISEQAAIEGQPRNTVATQRQSRKIYQYSLVPGGVYSTEELARARRLDRVVATHYADFDAHAARLIQLSQDQLVYVSYRKADKVFWTQGRHKVKAGEAVVTDGKTMARSRCGNRLSATPKLPTAKTEPPEAALGAPQPVPSHIPAPPETSLAALEPPHPSNTAAAPAEALPQARTGVNNGYPTPSSLAFPADSPILGAGPEAVTPGGLAPATGSSGTTPGGGTPITPPGGSGGTTTPIVPITSIPEPGNLLVLGVGLALCLTGFRRR